MRIWTLLVVAGVAACGGAVVGGSDNQSDSGSQPGSPTGTEAGAPLDAGEEATAACIVPAAAHLNQPDPTDMGCWAQLTSFPVLTCPAGTYSMTCGNPMGGAPPPELDCPGPGVGGPPHNQFYCCPCGPLPDSGAGQPTDGSSGDAIVEPDGGGAITDATIDVTPAPPGLAGFAFVVNGAVQTPLSCAATDWEFPLVSGQTTCANEPPCPGIQSATIVNTGALPMPYIAQSYWQAPGIYSPGVPTGQSYQLTGVLGPGEQVDITSVYVGGITALLGSSQPFSDPDSGKPAGDEGIIPWPPNVAGSGGSTQMYVAEIEVYSACQTVFHAW